MELDWCSDDNLCNFSNFNENSIINNNLKKSKDILFDNIILDNNLNLDNCFLLDLNNSNNKNILEIINYLKIISNYLRTLINNKSLNSKEIKEITFNEYNLIIKYLDWQISASIALKKYFTISTRKDNSCDTLNFKLFKTSSYKFCNLKECCSIHKNKKSKCDKNHFVFDMIINDILKLKESIEIIGFENINWMLNNKFIETTYDENSKKYYINNVEHSNNNFELNQYKFIIDKTLIFKSFNVISYVLNKMYDESSYFLKNNIQTLQINIPI